VICTIRSRFVLYLVQSVVLVTYDRLVVSAEFVFAPNFAFC
jgi:hypothetical protein